MHVQSKQTSPPALPSLKSELRSTLADLNRGLSIDADSIEPNSLEEAAEDLIEQIEDMNPTRNPARSVLLHGDWTLLYTSSRLTRYFGGVTGLQRLVAGGSVGRIGQHLDVEDGTAVVREEILFSRPFGGGRTGGEAVATGKIRFAGERRMVWEPEFVKFWWFRRFAEGWKTLRALQVGDITFLDAEMRIMRGQTGSVMVFVREE